MTSFINSQAMPTYCEPKLWARQCGRLAVAPAHLVVTLVLEIEQSSQRRRH